MSGLGNENLILCICEFDANSNEKRFNFTLLIKKKYCKMIFKPPAKFAEIIKITRVLKFKFYSKNNSYAWKIHYLKIIWSGDESGEKIYITTWIAIFEKQKYYCDVSTSPRETVCSYSCLFKATLMIALQSWLSSSFPRSLTFYQYCSIFKEHRK